MTDLQSCHQRKSKDDGESSKEPRHPILVKLVSGENLKEGDIEESSSGETLENTDDEEVECGKFTEFKGNDETNNDTTRSVDTQNDHEDEDFELLDPT